MDNEIVSFFPIFNQAVDFVKRNIQNLLKAFLAVFLVLIILFFIPARATNVIATTLLITFITTIYFCEQNSQEFSLDTIIAALKEKYLFVLALSILLTVINVVGIMLLVLPGIYCAITFQFTIWSHLFQKDLKFFDSFIYSKKLLDGRWWQVFWVSLALLIGMVMVYLLFAGIYGILAAILGKTLANIVSSVFSMLPTSFMLVFQMYFYMALEKTKS